jgi:hypothetical protein
MFQIDVVEKIKNTRFIFGPFFLENRAVYDIMWRNVVEPGRPQMTIWRMYISRQIHKARNTNSEYVMLTAFRLQQLLQERTLTLILLTWRKWRTPNNASKWQMGFNSAFKGLMLLYGPLPVLLLNECAIHSDRIF